MVRASNGDLRVALLAVLVLGLVGCGGGGRGESGAPKPIDVPDGLFVRCERALDGGTLVVNAPFVDATVSAGECLIYELSARAGETYSAQVLVGAGGEVDVVVSARSDFTDLQGASSRFGDDAESATFTADSDGTHYVALVAESTSRTSTRVVANVAPPEDVRCTAIDGGEIEVDAPALLDVVFPNECVLYSFQGETDAVYRITVTPDGAAPEDVIVAQNPDLSGEIARAFGNDPPLYVVTDVAAPRYVGIVGDSFELSRYEIRVEKGNAPIGLAPGCFLAVDRGALPLDWMPTTQSLVPRTCDLYTLDATSDSIYFVSTERFETGVFDPAHIARDAAFRDPVTTTVEDVRGMRSQTFVADASGLHHVAVLHGGTDSSAGHDYNIRALESVPEPSGLDFWCNRATARGALTVDGAAAMGTVESDECATYTVDVQAGVTYSALALASTGSVGLFVAVDAAHATELGSLTNATNGQGFAFTPTSSGTIYVTVAGRADESTFSLEVVSAGAAAAGLASECAHTIDRGALGVDSSPVEGFAPADHCVLYSFSATAGSSYTVDLRALEFTSPDLSVAADAAFQSLLGEASTPGDDAVVFTAPSSQAVHVAVYGFQSIEYSLRVLTNAPPPAGLASRCAAVVDGGTLGLAAPIDASAAPGQCVTFSFSATTGAPYTLSLVTSRGDPGVLLASDAAFAGIIATETGLGGHTVAWSAMATQTYHVAVFPETQMTTDFEVTMTTP